MCNDPRFVFSVPDDKVNRCLVLLQLYAGGYAHFFGNIVKFSQKKGNRIFFMCRISDFPEYNRFTCHFALKQFFFKVPCRKCLGCLNDRRNEWASRCLLEAKEHKHNCFITLTYRESDKPPCLVRKHFQDFMKRLRERFRKLGIPSPRVYYRGEYGERFSRPHFHFIAFNCDFPDKRVLWWMKGNRKYQHAVPGSIPYYTSEFLEETWQHGFVLIAPVCLQSIKYVCNYLDKGQSPVGYEAPPFNGMSRRPAIGRAWFNAHFDSGDMLEVCHITSVKLPCSNIRYYRRLLRERSPDIYDHVLDHLSSIAAARPCFWDMLGISESEYLQRREDKIRFTLEKFGRKVTTFY